MQKERTFSIIKPDAVRRNLIGAIIGRFESEGLRVAAARLAHLSKREAEGFYAVHRERPFFGELVETMTAGPVLLMVLEGDNAIQKNRQIMGATDPSKAEANTLRKQFGLSISENTVHGSDAPATAREEIAWFFGESQVF
jgi:nucleoside-diphosphate kinase